MTSAHEAIPRPGARVIMLDRDDRVLLLRTEAPEFHQPLLWIAPGGALAGGESHEDCARREVWEETGLRDFELGPCIWLRRETWRWGETLYDSRERYFLARVDAFDVRPQQLGEMEELSYAGYRWWSVPEIAASSGPFVPLNLAELLPPLIAGDLPPEPIEVGE